LFGVFSLIIDGIICRVVSTIQGGAGFLPSTVCQNLLTSRH
jgi:hypothetical protein